ncbi:hypothetical protein [Haloarcula laminariae]|uniref:hypothetical protein n=1 Tax=Haloarcula laminariae TaxID=2961577 RepID=UPI0021CA6355|nr:hypothetical protein [Halomicroarcula laminariae]
MRQKFRRISEINVVRLNNTNAPYCATYTGVELIVTASPSVFLSLFITAVLGFPPSIIVWFSCGIAGLGLAIVSGRTNRVPFAVLDWPRPDHGGDLLINAIGFNGVLLLGTIVAEVVWRITASALFSVLGAALLPTWFLKHIQFIVFIDSE